MVHFAARASEDPIVLGALPVWQGLNGYNDSDKKYSVMMMQFGTNFAKTGGPNGGKLVTWPKYDSTPCAYLNFTDAGPVVKEGLRSAICDIRNENQKRTALE